MGILALVLWETGQWQSTALVAHYVPMAPITSSTFAVLGLGLVARRVWPARRIVRFYETMGALFGIAVALLAMGQTWFNLPVPWDWLFKTVDTQVGPVPLGRMALNTAAAFLLASLSILARQRRSTGWISTVAAGASLVMALVVLAGFAAGAPVEYTGRRAPMALLTAVAFVLLNASILLDEDSVSRLRRLFATGHPSIAEPEDRAFAARLGIIALVLSMIILVAGITDAREELLASREVVKRELGSVANLKAAEILQWREERLGEGRFLQRTPHVAADIAGFLARPDDPAARRRVVDWLEPIKGGNRYRSALLYDAAGHLRLALPEAARNAQTLLDEDTPSSGTSVSLGDFRRDDQDQSVRIDLRVPLRTPTPATILLEIDPTHYLFPSLARWPSTSETAEALIVRREGDQVVYLSPLRGQPDAPLRLRHAVAEPLLPASRAARGEMNADGGMDYRGVAVLSTARPIPQSSWILIAKVDQAEVYGPIRSQAVQSGLLLSLIVLSIGLATAYLWRLRHAAALERGLKMERERASLAERLAQVMRNANDLIIVFDTDGRIVEANERALATFGYGDEEMRSLSVADLRAAGSRAYFEERREDLLGGKQIRFDSWYRRKDGSVFPADVNARTISLGDRTVVLAVCQDITERRAHEEQIERLNRLYAALSQVNQAVVRAADEATLLSEVCRTLVEFGGFRMAWIGAVDPQSNDVVYRAGFGDDTGYLNSVHISLNGPESMGPTGTAIREGLPNVCRDVWGDPRMEPWRAAALKSGYMSSIGLPLRLKDGVRGALTVYARELDSFGAEEIALLEKTVADTEFGLGAINEREQRRLAEAATADARLQASRFSEALDRIPAFIYMKDLNRSYIYANRPTLDLFRLSRGQLPGKTDADFFPAEAAARLREVDDRALLKGEDTAEEISIPLPDGSVRTYWEIKTPIYEDGERRRICGLCGISTDITEIKAAQEALRVGEERLRRLGDNLPESYVYQFTYDSDGTPVFLYVSEGVERVHGLKPADVLKDASLIHKQAAPEQLPDILKAEGESLRDLTDFSKEVRIQRVDGEWRWLQIKSRPRRHEDGRVTADGVATDITDRKILERTLAENLREVRMRNEELSRFNRAMVDRELRMVELKGVINGLLARLGEPARFVIPGSQPL